MQRRTLAVPLATVAVAGLAGGAYAATQSGSSPQAGIVADAAKRLHVTPQQLSTALRQALIDRLDAAVKAGRLTKAQAHALEQRISKAPGLPFFGGPPAGGRVHPGLMGPHSWFMGPRPGFMGPRGFAGPRLGTLRDDFLNTAASYLGLSVSQLTQKLHAGKTLAQIAAAQGKTTSGLEQALTAAARTRLDKARAAGRITRAQEQALLSLLSRHIDAVVTHSLPPRPFPLGRPPAGRWPGGAQRPGGLPPSGFWGPPPAATP